MTTRRARVLFVAAALLTSCANEGASRFVGPAALAVRIEATGCGPAQTISSGGFVDDGVVLTVAHGVAGASTITVTDTDGDTADAELIAIDTADDLALLMVEGLGDQTAGPARFAAPATAGAGTFVGYSGDGGATSPFEVRRSINISMNDIYNEQPTERAGLEVAAPADRGDSGALLRLPDGAVVGMLFASSQATDELSYATAGTALETFVNESERYKPDTPAPCPG